MFFLFSLYTVHSVALGKIFDLALNFFISFITIIRIYPGLVIKYILYFSGYSNIYSEIIRIDIDWLMFNISSCLLNFHKLILMSAIFKFAVFFIGGLFSIIGISCYFLYMFIAVYIIGAFLFSNNKLLFILNLFLLITFWNSLGLLVLNILGDLSNILDGLLKSDSPNQGSSSLGGTGSNHPQGYPNNQGGPNPQGGGPDPNGDTSWWSAGAAGVENDNTGASNERAWSKAGYSTGYQYASGSEAGSESGKCKYISSDDFSEYSSDENLYKRGVEKGGYIAKSHKIFNDKIDARIKSLEEQKKGNPEHASEKTGLKGGSNACNDIGLDRSLKIHQKVWEKVAEHMRLNFDSGYTIFFKPADNTKFLEDEHGKMELAGQARFESKGAALYYDPSTGKIHSLTNNKLKNIIKKEWIKDKNSSMPNLNENNNPGAGNNNPLDGINDPRS